MSEETGLFNGPSLPNVLNLPIPQGLTPTGTVCKADFPLGADKEPEGPSFL